MGRGEGAHRRCVAAPQAPPTPHCRVLERKRAPPHHEHAARHVSQEAAAARTPRAERHGRVKGVRQRDGGCVAVDGRASEAEGCAARDACRAARKVEGGRASRRIADPVGGRPAPRAPQPKAEVPDLLRLRREARVAPPLPGPAVASVRPAVAVTVAVAVVPPSAGLVVPVVPVPPTARASRGAAVAVSPPAVVRLPMVPALPASTPAPTIPRPPVTAAAAAVVVVASAVVNVAVLLSRAAVVGPALPPRVAVACAARLIPAPLWTAASPCSAVVLQRGTCDGVASGHAR